MTPESNLARALAIIFGTEGGYVNDPRDPGGETKYGIAKAAHPNVDIKALTLDGASAIYAKDYWAPARCDDLPWPLSLFVFDAAVNQGVDTAKKLLQKSLNTTQDGLIGNNTLAAVRKADQKELCALFMADRALRYTGTRNFDTFGRGWFKRLFITAMEA
jgi:lysozyme family protein